MNFELTPFIGVTQISTSSDIPTNTGSIHAALSWSPNPLAPNTQSTLNISFYDPTGSFEDESGNARLEVLNTVTFSKHTGKTKLTLHAVVVKL